MSESNKVRDENTPEENENLGCPTFDYNEQNSKTNRLYVSELPENASPGIRQRREGSQELILKFDWYFSTSENEMQSKEFTVPKSGEKFLFRATTSPWMEHGKQVHVFLLVTKDCSRSVGLEYTAMLRNPDWKSVEEIRGGHEFNAGNKSVELFSVEGKPVDVWPVDPTIDLIENMALVPRVYAIKGTLKYISDRAPCWRVVTKSNMKETEETDLIKFDE